MLYAEDVMNEIVNYVIHSDNFEETITTLVRNEIRGQVREILEGELQPLKLTEVNEINGLQAKIVELTTSFLNTKVASGESQLERLIKHELYTVLAREAERIADQMFKEIKVNLFEQITRETLSAALASIADKVRKYPLEKESKTTELTFVDTVKTPSY